MRILLTGGTGFLGKRVLEALVNDPNCESVTVLTRRYHSYPNPKVTVVRMDITDQNAWDSLPRDFTQVVHLAGLYDLEAPFSNHYTQNVVPMLHITQWMQRNLPHAPIVYASTYVVNAGNWDSLACETPVMHLPPRELAYAHTKAMAEQVLTRSPLTYRIMRLGILVGESRSGLTEKWDGPYLFMHAVRKFSKLPGALKLPYIPVPTDPKALLPLLAVDHAADVALKLALDKHSDRAIFGVYPKTPPSVLLFSRILLNRYLPKAKPFFMHKVPASLRPTQAWLNNLPENLLHPQFYARHLHNENFQEDFADFADLTGPMETESFWQGFESYSSR